MLSLPRTRPAWPSRPGDQETTYTCPVRPLAHPRPAAYPSAPGWTSTQALITLPACQHTSSSMRATPFQLFVPLPRISSTHADPTNRSGPHLHELHDQLLPQAEPPVASTSSHMPSDLTAQPHFELPRETAPYTSAMSSSLPSASSPSCTPRTHLEQPTPQLRSHRLQAMCKQPLWFMPSSQGRVSATSSFHDLQCRTLPLAPSWPTNDYCTGPPYSQLTPMLSSRQL